VKICSDPQSGSRMRTICGAAGCRRGKGLSRVREGAFR
jgi:hypothetical protein